MFTFPVEEIRELFILARVILVVSYEFLAANGANPHSLQFRFYGLILVSNVKRYFLPTVLSLWLFVAGPFVVFAQTESLTNVPEYKELLKSSGTAVEFTQAFSEMISAFPKVKLT